MVSLDKLLRVLWAFRLLYGDLVWLPFPVRRWFPESEIVKASGLSRSTVRAVLRWLLDNGYVSFSHDLNNPNRLLYSLNTYTVRFRGYVITIEPSHFIVRFEENQ